MRAQRIHPAEYGALTEALATIYWYKQDLAQLIRRRSTGHPELIAGLDFDAYKRVFADEFVDRLMEHEDRYRDVTLALMLEIAQMTSFPSLKRQPDGEKLLAQATEAVADLKAWVERLQGLLEERAKVEAEQAEEEERQKHRRGFSQKLYELKEEFLRLQVESNRQRAGSFTFDTDDYVLEAKWWKEAVEAGQLREFNDKVRRKGKNALGLFISVNGFTSGARAAFREGTSFLTMDGTDLFCVLDDRVRLDDLLARKKRHANETGNCYFPAQLMLGA